MYAVMRSHPELNRAELLRMCLQDPKLCHTAQEVAADLVGLLARRCQPAASGQQQDHQQPRLPGNYSAGDCSLTACPRSRRGVRGILSGLPQRCIVL